MNNDLFNNSVYKLFFDIFELTLFGAALFFLIPPTLSNADDTSSFMTSKVFAIGAFTLGRVVAAMRRKRSIVYTAAELLIFWIFAWVLYLRFQAG
ncbi:MAG TPA: hypothetical protein VN280_18345 [Variovorax sp.]|nr:hypothetical protein [Variovorax sp.]